MKEEKTVHAHTGNDYRFLVRRHASQEAMEHLRTAGGENWSSTAHTTFFEHFQVTKS